MELTLQYKSLEAEKRACFWHGRGSTDVNAQWNHCRLYHGVYECPAVTPLSEWITPSNPVHNSYLKLGLICPQLFQRQSQVVQLEFDVRRLPHDDAVHY